MAIEENNIMFNRRTLTTEQAMIIALLNHLFETVEAQAQTNNNQQQGLGFHWPIFSMPKFDFHCDENCHTIMLAVVLPILVAATAATIAGCICACRRHSEDNAEQQAVNVEQGNDYGTINRPN